MENRNTKIPKIIHYCWFGNKQLSEMAKKCIASWKKQCPDYKIIEWNEENFDINCNTYVKEAYREKKWAFVSDVARLHALVNYGGIYMDTDVEVLKSLNVILNNEAIIGFECDSRIQTGFMACVKFNKEQLKAETILIKDKESINELQGSKYLQSSNFNQIIKKVQDADKNIILFGTPCQIAGIKKIFGDKKDIIYVRKVKNKVQSLNILSRGIRNE